jgi:hypothetical protein
MKIATLVSFLVVFSLAGCANQGAKNAGTPAEPIAESSSDMTTKIAGSGTGLLVIKEVTFGSDASVPEAVKNECALLSGLSAAIKANAAHHYATVLEGSTAPANADVLSIEIINLMGPGGGAWSGGKSVMIKGTLSKQGKAVSSFKALRVSGGGVFGGYMGTCAILGRCVRTLGKDVAGWLQNPTPNATLGNM